MEERSCGTCNACCKILAVTELEKPAGEWCQHCAIGQGCLQYARRPKACRQFDCLWKMAPNFFPLEARPDKCKVMWVFTKDGHTAVAIPEERKRMQTRMQQDVIHRFRSLGFEIDVITVDDFEG